MQELLKYISELEEKVNVYGDALKYYADEMHYEVIQKDGVYYEEIIDRGEVAKNALKIK